MRLCFCLMLAVVAGCGHPPEARRPDPAASPAQAPAEEANKKPKATWRPPDAVLSDDPAWTASCDAGGRPFSLEFKSKSGHVDEDDMDVTTHWDGGSSAPLAVKPAWYLSDEPAFSEVESVCKRIVGVSLPGGRVLLWLPVDDRPSYETLTLVLVDPATTAVVNVAEGVGSLPASLLRIVRTADGFEVMMARRWILDRISGGEGAVPDWMTVRVNGDRIAAGWR